VASAEWPAEISHTNEQIITTAAAAAAAKQAASAPAAAADSHTGVPDFSIIPSAKPVSSTVPPLSHLSTAVLHANLGFFLHLFPTET